MAGIALDQLRAERASCRACGLFKDAGQTVFGQGPAQADGDLGIAVGWL